MPNTPKWRASSGRPGCLRRYFLPVLIAGFVGVVIYERRILAGLDATPDPDGGGGGFAFPADRVHTIATADLGRLHVEECGTGPPVVLVHGHGANVGIFAPLAARLTKGGRRVVALDQRGFGRSSAAPRSFTFRDLVDDLATVLHALDLRDAVVAGHSMGGAIALGLATERPDVVADRVAALVVINSSARGPADRLVPRAKAAALDGAARPSSPSRARAGPQQLRRRRSAESCRRRPGERSRQSGRAPAGPHPPVARH
jgi:pimeloyl-ACP methyl ester carboxylesterase